MSQVMFSLFRGEIRTAPPRAWPRYCPSRLVPRDLREDAVRIAAIEYGCSAADILGERKFKHIAHARQYAMWLLRQVKRPDGATRFSLPEIAFALNRKDHTTVIHAIRAHEARLAEAQGRAA